MVRKVKILGFVSRSDRRRSGSTQNLHSNVLALHCHKRKRHATSELRGKCGVENTIAGSSNSSSSLSGLF